MKKIFYILVLALFVGCEKSESTFDVTMLGKDKDMFFEPISGGALMTYILPDNDEVLSIRIRYTDARGNEIIRTGSYAANKIELIGFDAATKGVNASVTLVNKNDEESEPVDVVFDTKDSGPVEFLNSVKVESFWDGFAVSYDISEFAKGMCHISYLGISPETNQLDTLPLKSFKFDGGDDLIPFSFTDSITTRTVIIKTEDLRGYIVDQKVYEDVYAFIPMPIKDTDKFAFHDPHELSIELEPQKTGWKYLFDKDYKGINNLGLSMADDIYYTFIAGPNAVEKPFIFDLGDEYVLSKLHIYGMLAGRDFFPGPSAANVLGYAWFVYYHNKLPCNVTIYGSNDMNDDESWVELGHEEYPANSAMTDRWTVRCATATNAQSPVWYKFDTVEKLEAEEPAYMRVDFELSDEKYRYIKMVVHEVYGNYMPIENASKYVSFHELEIFTIK